MPSTLLDAFGANLDHIVKVKRVRNREIASALRKNPSTVSRWRSGKQAPNLEEIDALAAVLDVPAFVLLLPPITEEVALNALKSLRERGTDALVGSVPALVVALSWGVLRHHGLLLSDDVQAVPAPHDTAKGRRRA